MNLCGWLVMVSDPGPPAQTTSPRAFTLSDGGDVGARLRVAPARGTTERRSTSLTRCIGSSRSGHDGGEAILVLRVGEQAAISRSSARSTRATTTTIARGGRAVGRSDQSAMAMRTLTAIFEAIAAELPRLHRKQDVEGIVRPSASMSRRAWGDHRGAVRDLR